jgi:3-oxoacyl-[acyl-carrier-protein] synthase I
MPPMALHAWTATTALGRGREAQLAALRERRSGLRRNDFGPLHEGATLPCWIGRVEGVEDAPLPPQFSRWECRNNRLAWMALQNDGLLDAVARMRDRHGAECVAVVVGTSTSSIGASEEAYTRLEPGADGTPSFPPDLARPIVHTPHSLGDFVQQATGLRGPCMTVATACSSSAKVFAQAARLIESGVARAALVGGVDTLCGSVLYGFNALQLVSREPCRPFDAARDGLSLGEAGGFAVLERAGAGNQGLPQLRGYGESSDAHHMSAPHPQGAGALAAMRDALARAGIAPGRSATSTCTAPRPRPTTRSRRVRSPNCSPRRCTAVPPRAGPGTPWARRGSWSRCSRCWRWSTACCQAPSAARCRTRPAARRSASTTRAPRACATQ